MTIVQEFVEYCEQSDLPSDTVGSAAFYANWRKIHTVPLTTDDWNDILDFVDPDVPPESCSIVSLG